MNKRGTLKVGLCGLGRAGWGMIREEILQEPSLQIVAGFDVEPQRVNQLAEAHQAAGYTDFAALLEDSNVELVIIATRSIDHAPMALQALKAGKNVLVEKPMALRLKDADRMIAQARKSRRKLLVRHNRRFDPPFLLAREVIESGRLGKVHTICLRQQNFQRRADWQTLRKFGGGQLFNWGPHLIDWGMRLLASPAQQQWDDLKKVVAAGDAEDHVKIIVRGKSGAVVDIEISNGVALPQPQWQIHGDRGSLVIQDEQCHIRYLSPSKLKPIRASGKTPPAVSTFRNGEVLPWVEEKFPVPQDWNQRFWPAVYEAVKLNKPFPVTLEEARDNLRIIEAASKT